MDKKIIGLGLSIFASCNLASAIIGATNYHLSSLKENRYTLEDYKSGVIINSNSPFPPYNKTKEFKASLVSGTTGSANNCQVIFIA